MHRIGTDLYAAGIHYLRTIKKYKTVRFLFELTLLSLVAKLLFVMVIGWGYETFTDSNFAALETPIDKSKKTFSLFFLACFFAPFVETFFFNLIPIYLLHKVIDNSCLLILAASIVFSIIHISYDYIYPIIIFPLSIILSFGFVVKMRVSFRKAFWVTFLIHALHNFISIAILFLTE
ncbi:CPBP family intramembrane glutamic endopeptidase [Fodinibius sediminis]|uniref:CAAX protease self-immunity n=1 Tax=Fodinibius sediminis TaxID=1214077 RepID=A0A521B2R0_9BACT|nr:CPBP family intramembrane glutamic endopeptidase [Fodinibius sediminis]SMO41383.1 CAAX protease self-immunity [Fodinibius sediminis]